MTTLIQLPDGNWVNPAFVEAITVFGCTVSMHVSARDLICVCDSKESAEKLRDELARKIMGE